jgi:hypothetical protein
MVHLSLIKTFATRGFFLLEQPFFKGEPFAYPPAADWLGAILVKLGISLPLAFMMVGWGLSIFTIYLLYQFIYEVFGQKQLTASLGILLFLGSGGLGWWYGLLAWWNKTPLLGNPVRWTEMTAYGIRFINTIDAEMLPQRAFLLGLPVGLYILTVGWRWWTRRHIPARQLITAGLLTGLLPLIHPHTLMVISGVWGWLIMVAVWQKQRKPIEYLWLLGPMLAVGLPLTYLTTKGLGQNFFWIKWGWLAGDFKMPWLWFWWLNWGTWLPLAIVGYLKSPQKIKGFLVPFAGLFLLANVLVTQPYDWDNSKIFTWVHLVFSGAAGWWLTKLMTSKKRWVVGLGSLVLLTSIASGVRDSLRLVNFSHNRFPMFSQEELTLANWVNANMDKKAVFLTSDTHRHWVTTLTGRQILMGYRGWLWSYGIDYREREIEVLAMLQGAGNTQDLLEKYGVDYVVIGPAEKDQFYRADELYYLTTFPVVFETPTTKIFAVDEKLGN